MTYMTAKATERKNLAIPNESSICHHGKTPSKQTVKQINQAFATAKKNQGK